MGGYPRIGSRSAREASYLSGDRSYNRGSNDGPIFAKPQISTIATAKCRTTIAMAELPSDMYEGPSIEMARAVLPTNGHHLARPIRMSSALTAQAASPPIREATMTSATPMEL